MSTNTSRMHRLFALLLVAMTQPMPPAFAADATVGTGTPASCTEAALNAAINTVQSDSQGGTVQFNCGAVIGGGGRTIPITAQKLLTGVITLDGGGRITLDAQNASRVFLLNPRPNPEDLTLVTLRNIVLVNGFSAGDFGGAILGNGGVRLDLENVTINNSRAGLTGGALAMAPNTVLNIRDSSFRENTGSDGGALAVSSETTIDNSHFVLNTASGTGNSGQGGAIQSWVADLSIRNSRFTFNLGHRGGAIYKRDAALYVENSHMENNSAGSEGGAVHAQSGVFPHEVYDTRFTGNIAIDAGGAIAARMLYAERCLFDNNRARNGGALFIPTQPDQRIDIRDSTLSNNFAQVNGGAADVVSDGSGDFLAFQITTSNNTAETGAGGDFHFAGTAVRLYGSSLLDGRAAVGMGGGSVRSVANSSVRFGGSLVFSRQGQDCTGTGFASEGANVGAASCNLTHPGIAGVAAADRTVVSFAQLGLGEFAHYGGPHNTYLPLAGSPALDTYICLASDLDARGFRRAVGPGCDSGAVERQPVEGPPALFRDGFE